MKIKFHTTPRQTIAPLAKISATFHRLASVGESINWNLIDYSIGSMGITLMVNIKWKSSLTIHQVIDNIVASLSFPLIAAVLIHMKPISVIKAINLLIDSPRININFRVSSNSFALFGPHPSLYTPTMQRSRAAADWRYKETINFLFWDDNQHEGRCRRRYPHCPSKSIFKCMFGGGATHIQTLTRLLLTVADLNAHFQCQ